MKFFKIVYIGDSAVGKSALIYRFVHNESLTDTKATVGIAFKRTNLVDADNNEDYDIQLWDTAGQEKFQSVSTHHYRGADGALLCYDISNPSTLQSCDRWLQELREHTDENVVVALVANKMDLSPNVDLEEARNYAKSQGVSKQQTHVGWCATVKPFDLPYGRPPCWMLDITRKVKACFSSAVHHSGTKGSLWMDIRLAWKVFCSKYVEILDNEAV
eukprot:GEMP01051157.1.p1 GENE.GEMP01051157.1~~GEMP01051157.1.p1  ORF type:complete len:216 (-),score=25.05 GEMP01051157.1:882-1529(-)